MNFDEIIDRRATHCVKYADKAMKKRAEDAIVMTLADMDLPCCPAITDALIRRAAHPVYGYQQFDELLPEIICQWYSKHSSAVLDPEDFIAMPSVNTAIGFCIQGLSRPGDGILIQNPSYSPFRKVALNNDRVPLINELILKEDHYEIDWTDLEEKMKQARLFILCSPHNPTSTVFTREQLEKMLKLAAEQKVTVIADEIHADWVYGTMISCSSIDPHVITLVSASKTFNLQGMQSSFLFIPDKTQKARVKHCIDALAYMNNQTFSHEAIVAAYSQQGEQWLEEAKAYVQENARIFTEKLIRADVGLKPHALQSTFLLWVDCSGACKNDEEVVDLFENRCHIYGSSGSHYQTDKPFIRLNIGLSRKLIEEAAERLIHQLK